MIIDFQHETYIMKTFKLIIASVAICLAATAGLFAQTKSQKAAQIQKLLNSKTFAFVAESATPMSGGNIRLTSYYEVRFLRDSLNSHLPYFGVAFTSKYGNTDSPLTFSSSDFSYDAKTSRKGGKTITIKINQPNDPDMLTLSVSPSGYGTLQVNSVNRQPISFYGTIAPLKENRN